MTLEYIALGVIFILAATIVVWRAIISLRRMAKKSGPCCSCGCGQKFKIPGRK